MKKMTCPCPMCANCSGCPCLCVTCSMAGCKKCGGDDDQGENDD